MNLANAGEFENFMGIMSPEELDNFMGDVQSLPTAGAKVAAIKRIAGNPIQVGPKTSRQELEARFSLLPESIKQGLRDKKLQIIDTALYAAKSVAGLKTIKMFVDDDNKSTGICNISSGKFEKSNFFLLSGVILLSGTSAVGASDVDYDIIDKLIRNGDFELKANGTFLTPSNRTSNEVFDTEGMHIKKGYWKLDSPKLIETMESIELNLDWGIVAVANTYLKAILVGSMITKY